MEILIILLIFLIAGLIHEVIGFGSSLVSMLLLAFFLPIKLSIPLVAITSLLITSMLTLQTSRYLDIKKSKTLLLGGFLGAPLGILFLNFAPGTQLKIALAFVLMIISVYEIVFSDLHIFKTKRQGIFGIIKGKKLTVKQKLVSFFVGMFAGIVGSALNANGAIVGTYTTEQPWKKEQIKSLTSFYLLIVSILSVIGHYLTGLINREVVNWGLLAIPATFIGLYLGANLDRKLTTNIYKKLVHVFIAMGSVVLFFQQ